MENQRTPSIGLRAGCLRPGLLCPGQPGGGRVEGKGSPRVIPPTSRYAELSVKWWQWIYSQPGSTNPALDTTGEFAAGTPKERDIFFLAGMYSPTGGVFQANRTITIGSETKFFFPVLNAEADNVGFVPPYTVDELRSLAARLVQPIDIYCVVDGVRVNDLLGYRVVSPVFRFRFPGKDNLYTYFGYDVPGKDWPSLTVEPAVSDGYFLLLAPLHPGQHTIAFGGTAQAFDGSTFRIDITYNITVKRED